jgi:hypothetical protein
MGSLRLASVVIVLGFAAVLAAPCARADDPCAAFRWDVAHERTLFAQEPQLLVAGQTTAGSPTLAADRLYQLQLKGQSAVAFPTPPGKKSPNEGTYAGLATLTVEAGGVYRIAIDRAVWVDVIANGSLIPAKDFQGRHGCNAPHKIVEFLLPARTPLTLQFSGSDVATVKVAVTRSPAGTS